MGDKIFIPFLDRFKPLIKTGRKTATSRNRRYGYPGDYFDIDGEIFILTDVFRITLNNVAYSFYGQEGLTSPGEFITVWRQLHIKAGYNPNKKVYLHQFKSQREYTPPFHIHEIDMFGRCRICGCDPTPYMETKKLSKNQGVVNL